MCLSASNHQGTMKDDVLPAGRLAVKEESMAGLHTFAIEHNGLSLLDLADAMKEDAKMQEQLVARCSELVEETVKCNDRCKTPCERFASFEGEPAPIGPSAYVQRILKYGRCSPCCIVIGLLYLERLNKTLALSSTNFQRLLLVAIMEASKFLDDRYSSNKRWAEVGAISTAELNRLELEFLYGIAFRLFVTREEYDRYVRTVIDPATEDEEETESEGKKVTIETPQSEKKKILRNASFEDVTDAAQFFSVLSGPEGANEPEREEGRQIIETAEKLPRNASLEDITDAASAPEDEAHTESDERKKIMEAAEKLPRNTSLEDITDAASAPENEEHTESDVGRKIMEAAEKLPKIASLEGVKDVAQFFSFLFSVVGF